VSLFLLTVSKYHIIHSRYGVRASLYTFFELVVLYLVAPARGSESHRTRQLALAGFFLGLGFYTYIAYRIFPLVLIVFFFQKTIREDLLKHWKPFLAACAISILVVMPLGVYYLTHFDEFSDRMKRTEVFKQKKNAPEINPAQVLWKSTTDTMAMFTLRGDSITRHNVHNEPMLSSYAAPFFLLGILITLINIRKPYALFLLLYFLIGLAPGILSVGAPNTPRTLGALPPAILFVSFGILGAAQIARAISPYLGKLLLAIVLTGNFVTGIRDSLFRFPQFLDALPARAAETWGMDRDPTDVAEILNNLGSHCEGYLTPQFFLHSTVEYLTYSESHHKLITKHTDPLKFTPKGYVAVIILQPQNMNGWWLRDDDGKNFYKWWAEIYKKRIHEIREVVHQSYGEESQGILTKVNDRELLDLLKQRFPKGKVIHYGRFDAFVVSL
jgi:hypothetical protein